MLNQDDDWRRCTKLIHQSTVECHVSGWRDTRDTLGDRAIPGGQDKLFQNGIFTNQGIVSICEYNSKIIIKKDFITPYMIASPTRARITF